MHPVFVARSKTAQPIWFVTATTFRKVVDKLAVRDRAFVKAAGFEPGPGRHLLLPGGGALFGLENGDTDRNAFLPGLLPGVLPAGTYRFANPPHDARLAALAFALGAYRFTRYRKAKEKPVKLVLPDGVDGDDLTPHRRGRHARTRPDQHAGQRSRARRTSERRRARLPKRHGAEIPLDRRRSISSSRTSR